MLANINQVLEFLSNNNIRVHHINPKGNVYIYHTAFVVKRFLENDPYGILLLTLSYSFSVYLMVLSCFY